MNTLPATIHDDHNGLTYTMAGDVDLPDFEIETGEPSENTAVRYLEEHRSGLFTRLILSGRLTGDLNETVRLSVCSIR